MLLLVAALGLITGGITSTAQAQSQSQAAQKAQGPIRLQFVNTDISDVLQAISFKTHAGIVYSALLKRPISINISANSVSEAIGFAASAAGLTFREMNKRYFVAPAADLKQLIESFGTSEMLDLNGLVSADAITLLTGATPYLTVRPAGSKIMLIGTPEDILLAKAVMASQARPAPPVPTSSEVVSIRGLEAEQAATMLQTLYPTIKAQAVAGAQKTGGAVGLVGPTTDVVAAKATIEKLDTATPQPIITRSVYRLYTVRYSSAVSLRTFLVKAIPLVTAVVGPEHVTPPEAEFKPLTSALSGTGGGTSAGSSTGSSTPGSANSSGGTSSSTGSSGGVTGTDTSGTGTGTGRVSGDADKASVLVLNGPESLVEVAMKLLAEVDVAPKQIMIEVQVVDISPQSSSNTGVNWNWGSFSAIESGVGATLSNGALSSPITVPVPFGTFSKVPSTFQATINAMVSHTDAKVLATPRIQVLDKDDASIFIGSTLNVEVSQSGISGTTVQVFQFPVGIILLVRPRVNPDGEITMHVHPVVSTITSIGSDNLPQTSSREAETTVRIHDGETVVIGGLIQDEMSRTVQEVPGLAKLPLIGQLFRSTSTTHNKSEIVVFITPHIIK